MPEPPRARRPYPFLPGRRASGLGSRPPKGPFGGGLPAEQACRLRPSLGRTGLRAQQSREPEPRSFSCLHTSKTCHCNSRSQPYILGSAKGLDSGRRGHRVGQQTKPIRGSGCERSGDAGAQVCRWLAATEAQLGGSVNPNRDLWLNWLYTNSAAPHAKRTRTDITLNFNQWDSLRFSENSLNLRDTFLRNMNELFIIRPKRDPYACHGALYLGWCYLNKWLKQISVYATATSIHLTLNAIIPYWNTGMASILNSR